MARNRKRRSDRRPNRSSEARRSGVATARPEREDSAGPIDPGLAAAHQEREDSASPVDPGPAAAHREREESPNPIEHAAPDAELAEAQLLIGRAQAEQPSSAANGAPAPAAEAAPRVGADRTDAALDLEEDDDFDGALAPEDGGGAGGRGRDGSEAGGGGDGGGSGGSLTPSPAARPHPGNRLVAFAQGSWRELQRVQWPDRRQVVQATGVVIGFVIVAGAFLGAADWVAGKIVHFILQ